MLFSKPIRDITFQDVTDFCSIWSEGIRVEYKQTLQTNHIPKVVSSFANTVGGIWIIGVQTDSNNRPVLPLQGFPNDRGIEERITQSCYQNLFPSLLPGIKILDLPHAAGNVMVVVEVPESIEAPHAVENTTKVYIRTNSTTERIELSEIDRIEYLLKRRREPELKREEMLSTMLTRSHVSRPALRVIVGPQYPYRPVLAGEVLAARIDALKLDPKYTHIPSYSQRVQQGFTSSARSSASTNATAYHFEVNLYGIIVDEEPLEVRDEEGDTERRFVQLVQIVKEVGDVVKLAKYLLAGTTINLLMRVRLDGMRNCVITPGEIRDITTPWRNSHYSVEDTIEAELTVIRETLDDDLMFIDLIADLICQLMWSFNWPDRAAISRQTAEILHANKIP